jgi:hypothetical protein
LALALPVFAADAPLYQLDALCRLPVANDRPLAPGNPSPSTRRMAEELAHIRATADPMTMAFLNDRLVVEADRMFQGTTAIREKIRIGIELGVQQMQAGRPDSALNTFNAMEKMVAEAGGKFSQRASAELRMKKAIAFLRMGEQENCIARHGPEACLFPLSPAAFHKVQRGSRGAVELFSEQLKEFPQDFTARWLLNIAHMTLGEYPDKVPQQWIIPPSAFASEYDMPRFPDISESVDLDRNGLAGGVIADDFDNDGLLDLVISEWSLEGQLRYYHNDGNGKFTERTSEAGLVGLVSGLNIMQTDYNNDGHLDIWVPRGAWLGKAGRMPHSLLKNNGDGTFTDVTVEAGLTSRHPCQAGAWFDFDGDGWLDLFKGNETTDPADPDWCELFRNNRDGTFTECAKANGIMIAQFVKGVAVGDYDNDGRPDIYISCRSAPNILLHNDGPATPPPLPSENWKFSDATRAAGVAEPIFSFPTWFFDYDNDGREDLFCSGYGTVVNDIAADYLGMPNGGTSPKVYHNNGNGTFSDVTVASRMNRVCHTMGCNYGDLDNDGWLDFYLATGDPMFTTLLPNRMFRNDGGKRFQEVTTATGTGHLQKGHGVAFADLDNDGDQDVYVVMGGAFTGDVSHNALFQNPGNKNHWLKLKLVGSKANRAAIGARIRVAIETPSGPRQLHRTVSNGASFGGNPLRQEIGLANATAITEIEIRWPGSDTRQVLKGFQPDHSYEIHEGQPEPLVKKSEPFTLGMASKLKHLLPAGTK